MPRGHKHISFVFSCPFRVIFSKSVLRIRLGNKDPCALIGCNNDRLFPEKCTVKDHISNTKLEKDDHYYIQTRHKDLFFPLQSYSKKTLRKNVRKGTQKYKRNVFMPPGHPIILLFNMAAVSVKRTIRKALRRNLTRGNLLILEMEFIAHNASQNNLSDVGN